MHIAHIDEKIWIFKNRQAKNLKIFGVKLGYFAVPLRHNYSPYDVFQSLYKLMMTQSFIWHQVWTDLGQK